MKEPKKAEQPGPDPLAEAVRDVAKALSQDSQEKRLEVGKHLMMLGNLAAGALVFGQAVSSFPFDFRVAFVGLVTLVFLYVIAWFLMKGGDRR